MQGYLDTDVIKMNLGGTKNMASTRRVLCSIKDSALEKMFSGLHQLKKTNDHVFIDRDAYYFEMLINYLRNNRRLWPEFRSDGEQRAFEQELAFWGIRDDTPNEMRLWENFRDKVLIEMLLEVPGEKNGEMAERGGEPVHGLSLKTWRNLGPIRFMDILRNSDIRINFQQGCAKQAFLDGKIIVYGQDIRQKIVSKNGTQKVQARPPAENKILNDYLAIIDQQMSQGDQE